MVDFAYGSPLHQYLDQWASENDSSLTKLLEGAGRFASTGTDIRNGVIPRPRHVCDIADAMGIPRPTLLLVANYLTDEDLEPSAINPKDARFLSLLHQIPDERHDLLLRVMGGMTEPSTRADGSPSGED